MALRRALAKRLYSGTIIDRLRIAGTLENMPFQKAMNAAKVNFHREHLTSPDKSSPTAATGFFRRFFQRSQINRSPIVSQPESFYFPIGDKLKQKLDIISGERLKLDGLSAPMKEIAPAAVESVGLSVHEAKKILKCSELRKVKSELKQIGTNTIPYAEFVTICSGVCTNRDQGLEFAKMLDEAGDVIVLGKVVFLRPDQVAKSMEKLILQTIAVPNDPRKQELEELERQKALIDQKAKSQVRGELYCGLGFIIVQTLGFMRLTFWELSWDVMEPICFFVASFHFVLAYGFFMRTSKEPTFEGFFQRRFEVKQRKLMEAYKFDLARYNVLCEAFYPYYRNKYSGMARFPNSGHGGRSGTIFG